MHPLDFLMLFFTGMAKNQKISLLGWLIAGFQGLCLVFKVTTCFIMVSGVLCYSKYKSKRFTGISSSICTVKAKKHHIDEPSPVVTSPVQGVYARGRMFSGPLGLTYVILVHIQPIWRFLNELKNILVQKSGNLGPHVPKMT